MSLVTTATVIENSTVVLLARVADENGNNCEQADLSTIVCKVFDANDPEGAAVATPSVVIADSIYDTLQTDSRWTTDSTGYNFAFKLPASALADGDKKYRVECKFTPVSGFVFWALYDLDTIAVRSE